MTRTTSPSTMARDVGHAIHRYSAIARPVEPKYPTNLAVLVIMGLALVAIAAVGLVRGLGPADAAIGGLFAALAVFATWAMGRDLAPDDNPAAFVALVPMAAAVVLGLSPLLAEPMRILEALLVLGLVRVVNRTVGPAATLLDRVALIALVLVVMREGNNPGIGLAAVVAFALDAVLCHRHPRGWLYTAAAAAAAGLGHVLRPQSFVLASPGPWVTGALVCAGLFLVVLITQPPLRSECDVRPHVGLHRDRVQGGMVVALLAAAGSLLGGDAAVQGQVVLWSAMLGVVLTRPWHLRSR